MTVALRTMREAEDITAVFPSGHSTVAAIFSDEQHARAAMRELHELGVKRAWIGLIRADEGLSGLPLVDSADGGGMFEAIGRMFGGEGDRSLHAVLTSHGIPTEQARILVSQVHPYDAVVTVEVEGLLPRVLEILESHGGDVGRPSGLRTDRNGTMYDSAAVFL